MFWEFNSGFVNSRNGDNMGVNCKYITKHKKYWKNIKVINQSYLIWKKIIVSLRYSPNINEKKQLKGIQDKNSVA